MGMMGNAKKKSDWGSGFMVMVTEAAFSSHVVLHSSNCFLQVLRAYLWLRVSLWLLFLQKEIPALPFAQQIGFKGVQRGLKMIDRMQVRRKLQEAATNLEHSSIHESKTLVHLPLTCRFFSLSLRQPAWLNVRYLTHFLCESLSSWTQRS